MRVRTLIAARSVVTALLAAALLSGSGCALFKKKPKPTAAPVPVTSVSTTVGPAAPATSPTPTPPPVAKPAASAQPAPKRPLWNYFSPFFWFGKAASLLPHKPKPPAAQAAQLIGTIKMVNRDDKFVLIDGASFQGPAAGEALVCITNQKETASLRASGMKNPPFIIADITSGTPNVGDKVYKP